MKYLKIENGKLIISSEKEIKENDYLITDDKNEYTIIDKDKNILRPYVEDILRKMNIQTLQIKLTKTMMFLSVISIIIFSIGLVFIANVKDQSKIMFDKFTKIENKINSEINKNGSINNTNILNNGEGLK